jgi:hypothetical protein
MNQDLQDFRDWELGVEGAWILSNVVAPDRDGQTREKVLPHAFS